MYLFSPYNISMIVEIDLDNSIIVEKHGIMLTSQRDDKGAYII